MKSAVPGNNTDDEIEVLAERSGPWGRIRIRERQGGGPQDIRKCSIFLTPDQLEEHARECLALAATIRSLDPEDHTILNFMLANMTMSPRDVAKHFNIPLDRIRAILERDLAEVMKG